MRIRFILISAMLALVACAKKESLPLTTESKETIDSIGHVFFKDDDRSFLFIKYDGDSTKCYDVQSVDYNIQQIAPKGEWNTYVAKKTTITKSCDGQEGQKRSIKIELRPVDHPKEIFFVLQHDADDIFLEHDHYHTVFNGCCDAEPIHKIYDYDGDLLLEGNAKIVIGSIPNNLLKFYVGYTPTVQDTSVIGTLHLVYNDVEKYDIRILSKPLPRDQCSQYSPSISLVSAFGMDSLDVYKDEYQLWELEHITSVKEFNNLVIRVIYYCEAYYPVEEIKIPIRNGKPFGKDSSIQHVKLVHLLPDAMPAEEGEP